MYPSGPISPAVLQPITGPIKFRVLRDYTYRVEYLQGMGLTLRHFKQLAYLASLLPITRVVRPLDAFLVEEQAEAIEADFRGGRCEQETTEITEA